MSLPPHFHKMPLEKRRETLKLSSAPDLSETADTLIESCIGTYPVPLGVASGFLINGETICLPMATEEASVIAAATHAARIVKAGGGFIAEADEPVISAQIFLQKTTAKENILEAKPTIQAKIDQELIPNIVKRGGGFRNLEVEVIEEGLCVTLDFAVCDAMGANIANTCAEALKPVLAKLTGGSVLMAIVTNSAQKRLAKARFSVPFRFFRKEGFISEQICQRIVEATHLAKICPERAVTHNKGIMNGVSALALATGNDTRAIEAAAHDFADHKSLTTYELADGNLIGSIMLPAPFGVVGGAISAWPAASESLAIMGHPDARKLSGFAAALGLGQNLAALFALVTEGIQKGHMRLHKRRGRHV